MQCEVELVAEDTEDGKSSDDNEEQQEEISYQVACFHNFLSDLFACVALVLVCRRLP